ncbi:MAG: branched-chain amino acid ABC transporter permease, partial [Nitrososphaerales archaeon]
VGVTATYLTTKVPNFAAGDFVVVGTYAAAAPYILWDVGSPYLTAPFGLIFGGLTGVVMYLLVLRPLIKRGSSLVVLMIATLAIDIIFQGIFQAFVEYMGSQYGRILVDRGYGSQFYFLAQLPDFQLFGYSGLLFVAPAALVLVSVGLYLLLTKSKFGVAMRAAIENANLAKTVGINVDRIYIVSWFLAGGIAGLAGGLNAIFTSTPQNTSALIIIDIFAGSVLGGLASIYGALIGGLIVGAAETYLTAYLARVFTVFFGAGVGTEIIDFQKGFPLAIMIVILLIAPQGLTAIHWRMVGKRLGVVK